MVVHISKHIIRTYCWVTMEEWLVHQTPNHQILGSSPIEVTWFIKNQSVWAMGDDNDAPIH